MQLCRFDESYGLASRVYTVLFAWLCCCQLASRAESVPIKLWKDGAPGTPITKPEDEPILLMYRPSSNPTTTAVVVIPGGGYGGLAMDHEGKQIAEWLNSFGVTAFVLEVSDAWYRAHAPRSDDGRPTGDTNRS